VIMAKKTKQENCGRDLRAEIKGLTENWKRALADYQNLEKRLDKEKNDFVNFANAELILKLLDTLANLEKAAEHLKDTGLDIAVTEFKKVLLAEGLEEIESLGAFFDPTTMEAVEVISGGDKNKVAEVLQKGYLFKGKILLPAKVKVYKGG